MKIYRRLATAFQAYLNCIENGNYEWEMKWKDEINKIVEQYLPSGSGFDADTEFDFNESAPRKLILNSAYHVMNDVGMYVGWITFQVVITPSLAHGFYLRVVPIFIEDEYEDEPGLLDYIEETMYQALDTDIN